MHAQLLVWLSDPGTVVDAGEDIINPDARHINHTKAFHAWTRLIVIVFMYGQDYDLIELHGCLMDEHTVVWLICPGTGFDAGEDLITDVAK